MPAGGSSRPDGRVTVGGQLSRSRLVDPATFFEQLERALLRNDDVAGGLAVLAVAVDPFTLAYTPGGWAEREDVTLHTAGRLVGCLHYSFPTAQVGPDEFLVLAEGVGDVTRAVGLAEQLLIAIRWPQMLASVTASIGIAFQEPGHSVEHLHSNAAVAMHAARVRGGNRCHLFSAVGGPSTGVASPLLTASPVLTGSRPWCHGPADRPG
jgi:GGDEF domain-containing protein